MYVVFIPDKCGDNGDDDDYGDGSSNVGNGSENGDSRSGFFIDNGWCDDSGSGDSAWDRDGGDGGGGGNGEGDNVGGNGGVVGDCGVKMMEQSEVDLGLLQHPRWSSLW